MSDFPKSSAGDEQLVRPMGGSAHPLYGATPGTLISLLRRHGIRRGDRWGVLLGALASSMARAPFSALEAGLAERSLARRSPEPPLFILGHWRSGTTHLYNLLSRSEDLAFVPPVATGMPADCMLLGRAFRPLIDGLLPAKRFVDDLPVHPDSPQEDEAAMANLQTISLYHGIYFPRRLREETLRGIFHDGVSEPEEERWERRFTHFLGKMSLMQPGRRLVVKNPVYTARLETLRRLFPGAGFVLLHRSPYAVFASMRRFYRKLLDVYALQPFDPHVIDELILEVYERMMDRWIEAQSTLEDEQVVEIPYHDLIDDPIETLRLIGRRLGIARAVEQAEPRFREHLEQVRSHQARRYDLTDDELALVESRLGRFIQRWGYEAPERSEPLHAVSS